MEIKKINLKEQTYNLIKDRILKRQYRLGESLKISKLSDELKISNTPIREALSYLESEGLVEFSDGKYSVVNLTVKDIVQLNNAVLVNILAALDIVIEENHTEKLIEFEKQSLKKQKKLQDEQSDINFNFVKTFVDFNRNIVLAADNKFLLRIFDNLFSILILATSYNKKTYKDVHYKLHIEIYDALVEKDYSKVRGSLKELFNKDESSFEF
ncbi:MAG: GntR family transcriptional regulator [Peptoniphilus sp.]|uniref:GntR family transcriptional regulator n=1 Tax=Peptoniphilus sp. TaxID=1971214 RepID=UPI002A74AB8B|nr:GntR family transcriptional regulator [Peptoniphilus sp.]MDY2987132.1 GntR family transcriptional regulator [Peptoniphilus sp.]